MFFHESFDSCCVLEQKIKLVLAHLSNLRYFSLLNDVVWICI